MLVYIDIVYMVDIRIKDLKVCRIQIFKAPNPSYRREGMTEAKVEGMMDGECEAFCK